jgi:glycosyltransferase involved in cell wall biosynthesis
VFDSVDEVVKGCFSSLNKGGAYYSAVRQADLVLATAETLFERAKEYNDNVILVPNGCDFSYFNNPQPKPNEYEQLKNPIILYSGAVATWVDLKLIKEAANVYSDYDFVIIGVEFNTHIGNIPPNLHFYGHQPYNRVASFIQYSNACIIPFKTQMAEVECCNPIKLYEYLACGKPVITTEMPETKDYSDYWGNDYFIDNIAKAVENDTLQKRKMRIEIAENNSWNERAKRIVSAIDYLN